MIPVATTTITVKTGAEPEPGEGRTLTTTATGVRAVIGSPSGGEQVAPGGGQETVSWSFQCDPTTIAHTDQVIDETTGQTYEVDWAALRPGLGLDHVVGELIMSRGTV